MVTKEKEIKMLEELVKADGYFAEYFKKDLEQMVANIKNDFPIELRTLFTMDGENQRQINENLVEMNANVVRDLKASHKNEVYLIFEEILRDVVNQDYDSIEAEAIKRLGRNEVIRLKRAHGIELNDNDIEYMVSKLS